MLVLVSLPFYVLTTAPKSQPAEFVKRVMRADKTGKKRVTETDLFFALQHDRSLAAELDLMCKLLEHLLDPP
jgi:hypothetical protein